MSSVVDSDLVLAFALVRAVRVTTVSERCAGALPVVVDLALLNLSLSLRDFLGTTFVDLLSSVRLPRVTLLERLVELLAKFFDLAAAAFSFGPFVADAVADAEV